MEVELLSFGDETLCERAVAMCVGKDRVESYSGFLTAMQSGHYSVLEHMSFTWLIKGVSRALTHQLVRHRIASYSQQSQRYCKVDIDKLNWCVVPDYLNSFSTDANAAMAMVYTDAMNYAAKAYDRLIRYGMSKEDARLVLPNATASTIMVTMNARAFIEACTKRRCKKAQWEIRELFDKMYESVRGYSTAVSELAVPNCESSIGCKEVKPCQRKQTQK